MKKHCLALAVASVMGLFSVASSADTTVPGGKIKFEGEVVDATCAVSSDSIDQTVILDQVNVQKLATAGQAAGQPKSFTIKLVDCNIGSTAQNASITFTGQTDDSVAAALANTYGAGGATHVALQMFGPDSKAISMGTASGKVSLQTGTNELPFSVDYIATDAASTVGGVSATATFHVTYS